MKFEGKTHILPRIGLIDQARGIAVILMVIFNYAFALSYLGKISLDFGPLLWFWLPRAISFSFIFISGLCMWISYSNSISQRMQLNYRLKFFYRGAKIFSLGIAITIITYLYEQTATIWFGILHLIGIATILSIPLLKSRNNLGLFALSILTIIGGILISTIHAGFPYLLWLGLWPTNWYTWDYFPILPWFGVFLMGILMGKIKYPKSRNEIIGGAIMDEDKTGNEIKGSNLGKIALSFLGRHSLGIYLLHQPVLLLILKIAGI